LDSNGSILALEEMVANRLKPDRWPGPFVGFFFVLGLGVLPFAGLDVDVWPTVAALALIGLGLAILVRLVVTSRFGDLPRSFRIAAALRGITPIIVGALSLVDWQTLLELRLAAALPALVLIVLLLVQIFAEDRLLSVPAG
jgi:hypothetical protein